MTELAELTPPAPAVATHDEIRRIARHARARRLAVSRVMVALCGVALALAAVPLVALLYELVKLGAPQLTGTFFTKVAQTPTLLTPNAAGGVSNSIIGTLALTAYASILAIPVGVVVGIYLAEADTKFASVIRVIAQTMAGAPSILMGLFAFSLIVQDFHTGMSAIAGSFALAVLMLPVIVIATEIAVRSVPPTLREAGLALGATPHKVSLRVVLPSAITGIVTGAILAVSRAIGETAPVMLVIGGGFANTWLPNQQVSALPLSIYENAKSEWPAQRAQVWGAALVLVVIVFLLSLSARMWASRKKQAGH